MQLCFVCSLVSLVFATRTCILYIENQHRILKTAFITSTILLVISTDVMRPIHWMCSFALPCIQCLTFWFTSSLVCSTPQVSSCGVDSSPSSPSYDQCICLCLLIDENDAMFSSNITKYIMFHVLHWGSSVFLLPFATLHLIIFMVMDIQVLVWFVCCSLSFDLYFLYLYVFIAIPFAHFTLYMIFGT